MTNVLDRGDAQRGIISESAIRRLTVNAIVDSGASTLVITREIQERLGLATEGTRNTRFANGEKAECGLTGAVHIRWKDRDCVLRAVVIPGAQSVLLGALPLEDMDLIINPVYRRLEGAHGNAAEALALSVFR